MRNPLTILIFHGSWNDVMGPFMYLWEDRYPLATALSMIGYKESGSNMIISQTSKLPPILS